MHEVNSTLTTLNNSLENGSLNSTPPEQSEKVVVCLCRIWWISIRLIVA